MKSLLFITAFLVFCSETDLKAQDFFHNKGNGDTLFRHQSMHDSRLVFRPLIANPFEGRVGVMYQVDDKKLRLDIGNSIDLIRLSDGVWIGADFYTFTRLRSEGNFKFPVETSDYFFGVNASTSPLTIGSIPKPLAFRLRLAHISSHMVDGLANKQGEINPLPFVYSREFADFTAAMCMRWWRPYIGLQYIWATQPKSPERLIPSLGFDFEHPIGKKVFIHGGVDCKAVGVDGVYSGQFSGQTGFLFYSDNKTATALNAYWFSGRSMHGMFFTQNDTYFAIGLQVMF